MKKTLMFLSAVALAANAYAADQLVAGTADAPNYYVLKAGRGTPYLAFSEEFLTAPTGVETRLHRTQELTQANVWAVTPGSEEGTIILTAYGTTRGLMNYVNADGAYYGTGATANVVKPQDIYPKYQDNGTVSLSINNFDGYESDGNGGWFYYTLDASNNSDFCGNWIPGDVGTNWTAFKLDLSNGVDAALAGVEQAALEAEVKAMVATYANSFNTYADAVPWVADILHAGVEALNNVAITAEYADAIATIWSEYTTQASATLNTMFDGKQIAMKNIRRANGGKSPYMSAGTDTYPMVASYTANAAAVFTLEAAEEGYYFYNAETSTYFALTDGAITTTAEKANAQEIKFLLQSNSGFTGVNMLVPGVEGHNALNADQNADTKVVFWSGADGGSIWSIIGASDEDMVNDAIAANVATLEAYVDAVPSMVGNILTTAIAEIKALNPSTTTAQAVEELAAKALADANELLATGMNGIKLTLRNLRQNKFMSIANGEWVYDEYNEAPETAFTFKAQAEGGYILYNEAANIYVGEAETEEGGQTNVTVATEEATALVVYPFLCKGGNFTGVALALEADPTEATVALNTNANAKIFHTYRAGDAGSIFALLAPGTVTSIEEVNAVKAQLQGIYDLSGRKLAAPVRGINIINGKKVLVK